MKNETVGVFIKYFVALKPNMCFFLAADWNEPKKAKSVNKNVVAKVSHNEYKDVLLSTKCLRFSMNRIQSKNHRTGT